MYRTWLQQSGLRLPYTRQLQQSRLVMTCQTLWPYLHTQRRRLLRAYGTALLLMILEVSGPVLIGLLVDYLYQPNNTVRMTTLAAPFIGGIILLVLVGVAQGRLLAVQREQMAQLGERVAEQIRNTLWDHVQHIPLAYTQQRGAGRLLVRFLADTRAVQQLVAHGVVKLPHSLLLGLTILIVLALISPLLALIVLAVIPMYVLVFQRLNPALQQHSRTTRRRRTRLSAYLNERITGLATVKAHCRQSHEATAVRKLTRSLARNSTRLARTRGYLEGLTTTTVAVSTALVLAVAAFEIQAGHLSGGQVLTFYALLVLLLPTFRQISTANRHYQEAQISLERLHSTLCRERETASTQPALPFTLTTGTVTFEQVAYTHPTAGPLLHDIEFCARRGEIVALTGPNGAGKSTMIHLLLRFIQPQQGRIMIDGQNIAHIDLIALRSHIGLVTQDVPLFAGTVAENIAYGLEGELDMDRLVHAAQLAGSEQMIDRLPDGWDTRVGPGGHALSGGQRQRIALARALVNDPPLLVLDEPSSALDAATEHKLVCTLRELACTRTIIVVAHRLATLVSADRIYVLDQGRIVESGTPTDLLHCSGMYARLFGDMVHTIVERTGHSVRSVAYPQKQVLKEQEISL